MNSPRCRLTLKPAPSKAWAAVAPEANDNPGPDNPNLRVQPWPAGGYFPGAGLLVEPALPMRLPLEMLHDVRDIDTPPVDAGLFQRLVEQSTGGTDKWPSREVFVVARDFSHHHDLRARRAFPKDSLGTNLPERARGASRGRLSQAGQRGVLRDPSGGQGRFCGFLWRHCPGEISLPTGSASGSARPFSPQRIGRHVCVCGLPRGLGGKAPFSKPRNVPHASAPGWWPGSVWRSASALTRPSGNPVSPFCASPRKQTPPLAASALPQPGAPWTSRWQLPVWWSGRHVSPGECAPFLRARIHRPVSKAPCLHALRAARASKSFFLA